MASSGGSIDEAARRRRILEAARAVFAEKGGLGAGLRPIAARAGCTTGAIYAAFDGKEDIYAALLEESLVALARDVGLAAATEADAGRSLRAAARAFFDYYQRNEFEYGLGLYLFETDGRKGLGRTRDATLNARLAETLSVFVACFERLTAEGGEARLGAEALSHSLFTALIGAVGMSASRRDQSLGTTAEAVLETLIEIHLASR